VTEAQQLGFGWIEQAHPDDQCAWKSALAAGEPFRAEFRVRHYSGSYHYFDMRATALRDAAGQIVKWSGLGLDIVERRPQEQHEPGASEKIIEK
jgi:PAS domain-containing protein